MSEPNLDNLTIPGGTILYFDDGSGERDLGYFESPNTEVQPTTQELKYYSNRSGKRRLAKTWSIQEEMAVNFKLNEPNKENLKAFFRGGDFEAVAGGQRFPIATGGYLQGAARLVCTPGDDMGIAFEIEIPLCQIKPNGAFNLDDQNVMELPMTLETLDNYQATPDYPYGRVVVYDNVVSA